MYGVLPSTVTAAPAALNPTLIFRTTDTLAAQWGLVGGATGYLLVASTLSANPPVAFTASVGTTAAQVALSGLSAGTSYYLFVAADGPLGWSPYRSLGPSRRWPLRPDLRAFRR